MKKYTKIWGEHISLKQLLLATLNSLFFVLISLLFSKYVVKNNNLDLLFGLLGILISFVINTILFKPKRNIKIIKGEENDN